MRGRRKKVTTDTERIAPEVIAALVNSSVESISGDEALGIIARIMGVTNESASKRFVRGPRGETVEVACART